MWRCRVGSTVPLVYNGIYNVTLGILRVNIPTLNTTFSGEVDGVNFVGGRDSKGKALVTYMCGDHTAVSCVVRCSGEAADYALVSIQAF